MQTGSQLRRLFASILLHCFPSPPSQLWDHFREHICNDLHYHLQHQHRVQHPTEHQVYNFGLFLIDKIMHAAGKSLKDLWDMPYFTGDWEEIIGNCLVAEQLDYDEITELERASSFNISKLVPKTSQ